MPQYEFFCTACKQTFSTTLTLAEYEKGKIVCPECGSPMRLCENRRRPGDYFLGCTKWPKCRGTRKVTPEIQEQLTEAGTT